MIEDMFVKESARFIKAECLEKNMVADNVNK